MKFAHILPAIASAASYHESFTTSQLSAINWINQSNSPSLCPELQQLMSQQKYQLADFTLDSGKWFQNDGIDEQGLHTKEPNSYHQASTLIKPLDLSTAQSLKFSFTLKLDQPFVDCTNVRVQLLDSDSFCVDTNFGLSLGIEMCKSLYQITSNLHYAGSTKTMTRFINAISIVPDDDEDQLRQKHSVEMVIYSDDTYQVSIDGVQDKERGSLLDDFELSGPREILDPKRKVLDEPTQPEDYVDKLNQVESIFSSPEILDYLEKYSEYLTSKVYIPNPEYDEENHKNILNAKLFKDHQISGIGVFVSEKSFAGLVVDDIKIEVE